MLSDAGNGAILFFVPDPPTDLAKNVNFISSQTAISISWMQAVFNGGRTVDDYRISYDLGKGGSNYVVLAEGVTAYFYTTASNLVPGTTYSFIVEARSSAGYSLPSEPISVLAA